MSWRVFATAAADPDFARLSDDQRTTLNEELFAWVEQGPPRRNMRSLMDVDIYEDQVPSGHRITYFVDESEPYIAILRVRPQLATADHHRAFRLLRSGSWSRSPVSITLIIEKAQASDWTPYGSRPLGERFRR